LHGDYLTSARDVGRDPRCDRESKKSKIDKLKNSKIAKVEIGKMTKFENERKLCGKCKGLKNLRKLRLQEKYWGRRLCADELAEAR
jgi:hypothetical protein